LFNPAADCGYYQQPFFFAKLGTAYFDYRKHGQFEWAAPAILFACLVFTLTAPAYIWTILGM